MALFETELKPCPFCGAEPEWLEGCYLLEIECSQCRAYMNAFYDKVAPYEEQKADIIRRWNRRVE